MIAALPILPVALYAVPLDAALPYDAWHRGLDDIERAHAVRFVQPVHARRFVQRRWALRCLLGDMLGVAPASVTYRIDAFGRPTVDGHVGIAFSTSHSGDLALIVLHDGARAVGVDLEHVRQLDDADDLVARFFSPRERYDYAALPPADRIEAFWRGWTVKEAFVKALGQGLSFPLDRFDIALDPNVRAAINTLRGPAPDGWHGDWPSVWDVQILAPAPAYRAALVGMDLSPVDDVTRLDLASLPVPKGSG